MAGGLHVHRGNSTTVLLRHYPELSDLYQGSTDFCNSFWGPDDCGVEILFARIRSAARTMEELRCFWKKRIAVEAEYAKKLAELGKFPLGTNETGDLRAALDTLRVQTEKQATQHFTCVQTMKLELEESVDDFIDRQNNHNITFQAAIESSYKAKKTRERDVEKARENFESDCELYNLYHARYTRLEGEELDGVPARLTMLAESMITAEKNYQNLTRTLGKQWKRWQGEWKSYCDQCHDLEEERIEFIKDHVWAYANAVSTTCVVDDESCEMVRVKLEDVDVAKELDKFVKDHGTGPMMEEAIPFISYKTSPSQLMRKPKMANFLRTSARAPMKCPTLPVGPLQAEPAGPGAVGTEKVHGNPNSTNSRQNIQQDPENGRNTTTSIQPSPPVTPVFQSTVLSYQLTGNSLASTTTASTRLNQRAQQQPQKAPTRGVDLPTVPRVGGASPVDTTVDIDSARSLTGGVEDQNDILAREPSASKKGREAVKTEVGNIESSAAISLGLGSTLSVPILKGNTPPGQEAAQNKSSDHRNTINSVVGAHPSSHLTLPVSTLRGTMTKGHPSRALQRAPDRKQRSRKSRMQPNQQSAPVRLPGPESDGFAGVGTQYRSPGPKPFTSAPIPMVQPSQEPSGHGPNTSVQRPTSDADYNSPRHSLGVALEASVQVIHDPFVKESARRSRSRQQPSQTSRSATKRSPPAASLAVSLPVQESSSGGVQLNLGTVLFFVKALYDYKATIPEEFDFLTGDIIAVTATPDSGWWLGMLLDESRRTPGRMVFPSNFVCLF